MIILGRVSRETKGVVVPNYAETADLQIPGNIFKRPVM